MKRDWNNLDKKLHKEIWAAECAAWADQMRKFKRANADRPAHVAEALRQWAMKGPWAADNTAPMDIDSCDPDREDERDEQALVEHDEREAQTHHSVGGDRSLDGLPGEYLRGLEKWM